jgi:hypothetical protein
MFHDAEIDPAPERAPTIWADIYNSDRPHQGIAGVPPLCPLPSPIRLHRR